jgi:hypothetical protein
MGKKNITTKHDKTKSGRKNTAFLDEHCPPNGDLGDLVYDDIELSGNVSNSLRQTLEKGGFKYKKKNKCRR